MQRDMKQWLRAMIDSDKKKTMPVLSFPAVQLMDVSVKELISDSTMQARGMKLIADRQFDGPLCRSGMLRRGNQRLGR